MLLFSFINGIFYCCTENPSHLYCPGVTAQIPMADIAKAQHIKPNCLHSFIPHAVNEHIWLVHTKISQTIISIVTKCDMHGSQRMNPSAVGDYLSLLVTPPEGQSLNVSSEISQHLADRHLSMNVIILVISCFLN